MASATSTPVTSTSRSTRSASRRAYRASSPSPSPGGMSRVQEKDELRHLNDRLANYIQRVLELESERSSMLLILEEKDDSKCREMGNVRRLYEVELADVRKSLDILAKERARLQLAYGDLNEEHKKLQARNQKKEVDLAQALTHWRSLETAAAAKDSEHSRLLSENRALAGDMAELQSQLENVEGVLTDMKTQLKSEVLRRVDVENRLQTVTEQLDLQRNISEQEIQEIQNRHESRLVEVDSGRRKEFESKMAETMQQLRQDHDVQIQQYKEELEKTFSAKLDNAQQSVQEKNDVALATRDELMSTKMRMEVLSSQLQQYQKEKAGLDGRVQELERTLDRERESWQLRLSQKEQELQGSRSQTLSQLEDYENLLDVKLALDMEINSYRKMLEVEEQRLHLSPSPSQHGAVPRAATSRPRAARGKKRKHEGTSGSSPAYKMSTHASACGAISVDEVDLDGNYVVLRNNSDQDQPLGGWVVRNTYPDSGEFCFQIPSAYVLAGGQTLTIWAADAAVETSPGDLVLQGHRSWGPVTNMRVVLLNPSKEEMAERRVVCVQGRSEVDTELGFDDEDNCGDGRQDLSNKEASCAVM